MAGGTWNRLSGKERPGTYINFETTETNIVGIGERGTVIMPLLGHNYGPAGEFITINNSEPDANYEKLGYSVYDPQLLLIKEILKRSKTAIVYIPAQGDKASGTATWTAEDEDDENNSANTGSGEGSDSGDGESLDEPVDDELSVPRPGVGALTLAVVGADANANVTLTGTAMYGGTRGNALSFDSVLNEEDGFDVTVYLDNVVVEVFEGLKTIGEVKNAGSAWIKFTGDDAAELTEFSAVSLTGGTDGTVTTQAMTTFLDAAEALYWNTMAWPIEAANNSGLMAAIVSKIKYLRDDCGKYRKAVVADYVCDYEGIINVVNSYTLSDGTALTHAQATAWVAGADAGADCVTSNTYKVVEDAADIVDLLTNAEAIAAIKAGKFFFSFNEKSEVAVEYDINSLTSYGDGKKAKSWRKNRVLRVLDSFGESVVANFPPNKFDNDADGWEVMEGLGRTLLKTYGPKSGGGIGAITNVDPYQDFKVDKTLSRGDEVYFNIGLQPVDSAEKLFFTITTR